MGYFQVKVICQWLKAKDKELSLFAMSYSFSCQGQEKSGASFFYAKQHAFTMDAC